MSKYSWKDMNQAILDAIKGLEKAGFKEPTVRSVYYVLGSLNTIPMTRQGYKALDAKIVEMRKSGEIPWGFFAVKRGTSDEAGVPIPLPRNFQTTIPYVTTEEWVEFWIESLRDAADNFNLPRWYGQKNLVEVWVEKDGLLGATSNWLEDLQVTVRAPQGYGAWEFIHSSLQSIKKELKSQKKEAVHILYAGDMDPSGKQIPYFLEKEALAHFEELLGVRVQFKEIALSPEQVRKYHLPEVPDSQEVIDKIHRDSRLKWYQERYPPNMFVELDAFYSLATKAAKELIRGEVQALFDPKVFKKTRKEEEAMRETVAEAVAKAVTFEGDEE